jgi:hypothetical protein
MSRFLRAAACAALTATGLAQAVAADTPPTTPAEVPTAAFFGTDNLGSPVISPDGDALAMLVRNKAGRRQLAVLDTADLSKAVVVASFDDADIAGVRWVNAKRLVFRISHESEAAFDQTQSGLYAVDRNGENLRTLVNPGWEREKQTGKAVMDRTLDPNHSFLRTLADGSDEVIIKRRTFAYNRVDFYDRMARFLDANVGPDAKH